MLGAIWSSAGELLLRLLEFFYGLTNSYGLAIVLLTILVRVLLYPLNQKQMTSMQHMQKIQPRIKVLQEKYADDKEKLNQEMMKLYKENKVNPAAGCFPLLVQLPILILLFNVLRTHGFGGATFIGVPLDASTIDGLAKVLGVLPNEAGTIGIMSVLSAVLKNPGGLAHFGVYGPSLLLLIGISVLTWAQQKFSGAGNNPQMATMNTIMPFFMAFICLSMPGGVMIYWGLSSLIGVAQQYWVTKKTQVEMQQKPTLYKNKPAENAEQYVLGAKENKKENKGSKKDKKAKKEEDGEYEYVTEDQIDPNDDEYEYIYVDEDEDDK